MKLCKDCKYFINPFPYIPRCGHPLAMTDPVMGSPAIASTMRMYECGPSGTLFEQAPYVSPTPPKKTPWYYGIFQ